jgi:ribosomal protein RSM22 (predicted rRNA methylase)
MRTTIATTSSRHSLFRGHRHPFCGVRFANALVSSALLPPQRWERFQHDRRHYHPERATASSTSDGTRDELYQLEAVEDSDDSDNDDDDDDQLQPWKTLLELPSRAAWRAADPHPPEAVLQAQVNVLTKGGATAKQIQRTMAEIIAAQQGLAARRIRERRRLLSPNTIRPTRAAEEKNVAEPIVYGPRQTMAFLRQRLHPNYSITKRVLDETKSLLKTPSGGWQPNRIIDMGIGVGCASAAALEIFPDTVEWIHGIDPSRCMRECAKSLLEDIISQTQQTHTNPTRVTITGSIATEASSSTFDLALLVYTASELPQIAGTLAAAAILWQKLAPNGVFVMIEPGTPDGFHSIRAVRNMLLDCCPPPDRQEEHEDEDRPKSLDQCHIIAPCTHNGKCPMERNLLRKHTPTQVDMPFMDEDDDSDSAEEESDDDDVWETDFEELLGEGSLLDSAMGRSYTMDQTDALGGRFCSFVQTMSSGNRLKRGEKFSYLVAQKRVPTLAEDQEQQITTSSSSPSFENERLRDLLAAVYENNYDVTNSQDVEEKRQKVQNLFEEAQAMKIRYLQGEDDDLGLELLQGDVNRASFGRIIRAPIKKKGHVYIDYCAAPGRLMRSRVTKALDYSVAPGLFSAARKSRWGGLWPDATMANKVKDPSS